MKKLLLKVLAACMFSIAAVIPFTSDAALPLKNGHFKSSHFNRRDHMKFKKVKKTKPEITKSKTHPQAALQRFDKKKMHSGEARSYLFGIPIKKKGYKPGGS